MFLSPVPGTTSTRGTRLTSDCQQPGAPDFGLSASATLRPNTGGWLSAPASSSFKPPTVPYHLTFTQASASQSALLNQITLSIKLLWLSTDVTMLPAHRSRPQRRTVTAPHPAISLIRLDGFGESGDLRNPWHDALSLFLIPLVVGKLGCQIPDPRNFPHSAMARSHPRLTTTLFGITRHSAADMTDS